MYVATSTPATIVDAHNIKKRKCGGTPTLHHGKDSYLEQERQRVLKFSKRQPEELTLVVCQGVVVLVGHAEKTQEHSVASCCIAQKQGDVCTGTRQGIWRCFCQFSHMDPDSVPFSAAAAVSFPLSLGGLGLRSPIRLRGAAHWASWVDSVKMIFQPPSRCCQEDCERL